jgi:hypothetical protein
VHAIGVCLGLIGVTIVVIAVNIKRIKIAPILVYVIGLVRCSRSRLLTTYVSPTKWVLRRFDHCAMQVSGREPWRICSQFRGHVDDFASLASARCRLGLFRGWRCGSQGAGHTAWSRNFC